MVYVLDPHPRTMGSLEECIGEFLARVEDQTLDDFGMPLLGEGLPVPPDARLALDRHLRIAFDAAAAVRQTGTISPYAELLRVADACTTLAETYSARIDNRFQHLATLPTQLATALAPRMAEGIRNRVRTLSDGVDALRCEIRATPLALVPDYRTKLTALVDEYRLLQQIGSRISLQVHDRGIERYAQRHATVEYRYRTAFLPLNDQYRARDWPSPDSLAFVQHAVAAMQRSFRPHGMLFPDPFPEYLAAAQQLEAEISFHRGHFSQFTSLRTQLRSATEALQRGVRSTMRIPEQFGTTSYLAADVHAYRSAQQVVQRVPPTDVISLTLYIRSLGQPSTLLARARHALLRPSSPEQRLTQMLAVLPEVLEADDCAYLAQVHHAFRALIPAYILEPLQRMVSSGSGTSRRVYNPSAAA